MNKLKIFLHGILVPLLLLVVWELCARAGFVSPVVMPAPSAVAVRWWAALLPGQAQDVATQSWLAWAFSGEMIHDAIASAKNGSA